MAILSIPYFLRSQTRRDFVNKDEQSQTANESISGLGVTAKTVI